MTETTPKLLLPYILPSQAQKHVTHNEALRALDAIVQLVVASSGANEPPETPAEGECHIVGDAPTGAWSGRGKSIAAWQDGGWQFHGPCEGWIAWCAAEGGLLVFDGETWAEAERPVAEIQNAVLVGVNTVADMTNRLAVSADATLLNHAGNGHQLKINKNAAGDTASVVFQAGWSGRAEFGLAGDDDWHVKVSPDGAVWHEAIVVDRNSGRVALPGNGMNIDRTLVLNLLPDSGRFQGNGNNQNTTGDFAAPSYLGMYNGSTAVNYGEFVHNNSSYGGSAGALAAEVDTLIQKIRQGGGKRYGVEWNVLEITQGTGTSGTAVTIESQTYYLGFTSGSHPMPAVHTSGFYIKVKTGEAIFGDVQTCIRVSYDGADKPTVPGVEHVLQNSDGWVWVEAASTPAESTGYNLRALTVMMPPGSACWYALPKVVPGDVRLHELEVLPNNKLYG